MSGPPLIRAVVLDDDLEVAARLADWGRLDGRVDVIFHSERLSGADLRSALMPAHIVCLMRERTALTASLIASLPNLRLIVTTGMKNDAVDMAAAAQRRITVCGTESDYSAPVEITVALMLALARAVPSNDVSVRAGGWRTRAGVGLRGQRLGLLGLGRIGRGVAAVGVALGMDVVAWSPHLDDRRAAEAGVRRVESAELWSTSDVVSVHLRLGPGTAGLVGAAELAAMKPTALLVNTSRGEIVDTQALVGALRTGDIAGAAMDVFDTEPPAPDDPLLWMPNVVLSPHVGYVTEANLRLFYTQTVEDIEAYLAGAPVRVLTT